MRCKSVDSGYFTILNEWRSQRVRGEEVEFDGADKDEMNRVGSDKRI